MSAAAPVKSPTLVVTGKVRLSYANVWEAVAIGDGDPKFSVSIIIPKTDVATIAKINAGVEAAKQQGIVKTFEGKYAKLKMPLCDGDLDRPDDPAYKGCMYLNANSKVRPGIIGLDRNPILDRSEVYSGCHAKVSINLFPYNFKGTKGVGAGLNNIMKVGEGDALSGRASAESDFAGETTEDDDMGFN